MNQHLPELVVNVLNREYPDVSRKITDILNSALPTCTVSNSSLIPEIVGRVLALKGIEYSSVNWNGKRGYRVPVKILVAGKPNYLLSDLRELLVAVIVGLYDPAKLIGYSTMRLKPGILQTFIEYTGSNPVPVYKSVSNAVVHYRIYQSFRSEVDELVEQLKTGLSLEVA